MRQHLLSILALVFLAILCSFGECRSLENREVFLDPSIDPELQEVAFEEDEDRGKREVNHKPDPKFAIKNAILGFVFNKINHFIDGKTAWVDQLDHLNVAKNKAWGIYPPEDSIASIAGAISGVIGTKLQAAAPLVSIVTQKLTSGSLGGSSQASSHGSGSLGASAGLNLGALLGGGGGGGDSRGGIGFTASGYGR